MERKNTEPDEQRSGSGEQREEYCDFKLPLGAREGAFFGCKVVWGDFNKCVSWGATAMILSEFRDLILDL